MSTRPLPVVICSNLAQAGAEVTIQALQLGAFAIIPKPKLDVSEFLDVAADDLAGIIRVAAFSKNQRLISSTSVLRSSTKMIKSDPQTQRVVVIGCSSVGAQGLESILGRIPHSAPGILVAHQMPRELVNAYAESLNQELALSVQVAESGDMIQSGHVYLAPGGKQLLVERDGSVFRCMVKEASTSAEPCRFADGLFQSAAREFGAHATGFVLDDMGGDALWGLKALQEAGAATYAQGDGAMFGTALEPTSAGSPTKLVLLEDIPLILSGSP